MTSIKPNPPNAIKQKTSPSWSHHLNLDTIASTLNATLLNPGLAWLLVLCLRAQVTPTTDRAWIFTVTYAVALTVLFVARVMNHRIAHGVPRTVDSAREVVLVTGGASGLGLVIAQMYAMRGVSVAVLDVRDLGAEDDQLLFQGCAEYYQCDVGDRAQLEVVKGRIENEVCYCLIVYFALLVGRSLLFEIGCAAMFNSANTICSCSWGRRRFSSIVPRLGSTADRF